MGVIQEGILPSNEHRYVVKRLSLEMLNDILTLQNIVFQQLENKEVLQKLEAGEFRYILEGNGLMIGAFVEDKLIAIRALLVPTIDEDYLGPEVGLKGEQLKQVIYQEISFVHPNYRGNGLQQQLATLIMDELEKWDPSYRYVCSTVAPFNIPSLKDKFNQQLLVKGLKRVYGNKLRYIFMKDLQAKELNWSDTKEIPMEDMESQQQLLDAGWIGYQLVKRNEQYWVIYGNPSNITRK